MTRVSGPVRDAVRRGDLGWLAAHLRPEDCTPAVLRLLVRHDDPLLRHLGLELLDARIGRHPAEEPELAGLLPRTPDGPPETSLLLARLQQRLWRHLPRPRWRDAQLPARVRIAWLRAEIANEPGILRGEPAGELLYQALTDIEPVRPEELVRELSRSADPVLRGTALRLAREGLHAALLAPGRAREHIDRLLDHPRTPEAVAALRELAEPWAAFAPIPRERLSPFLAASPGAAPDPDGIDAALAVAARHGHGDLLRDVIADEAMPPRSRQTALEALGALAGRADIPEITALAATDPLLLGGSAVACLRAMHRRGLFPGADDAAAVVDLALADHRIYAAEVATILFTCRHAALRALVAEDADDPSWPRRLALLVGLAGQGDDGLPVGDVITGVLTRAARPRPFLDAIRALQYHPAEAAVLDALPRAPDAALHALEAIGGSRTVAALEDGPVRHHALELLWHLTDDPDRRRTILARLDPRDLPRRIVSDLGAPDRRELALLAADLDPEDPVRALVTLARNGDAGTLPSIADVLLRIVSGLAAPSEPVPEEEPAVPEEVVAAVRALGARLHHRGKLRPFCLREAADADAAGHALVATVTLDLLDRPGLSAGEQAILLALLREAPYPGTRARVHRLLRHRDRHVRKQVIALLAAGDGVDGLSASLIALTAAGDTPTVRQALRALGGIRARWAAPAIAACLDHPTMNIKKTAAEALVRAGTPAVVPALLFWLGHHDNPGLRATLVEALRTILGDAYPATVLAAAERSGDDRTRELLLDGLGRLPSARAADALARQGSPIAPLLLAMVAAGRVTLASGTVDELAAQLAAHGIAVPSRRTATTDDRADEDVDALALDGWDAETALRLVHRQARLHTDVARPAVDRLRPMLADWFRLADAVPDARASILLFTVRLCPAPWSADEVNTITHAAGTLVSGLAETTGDDRDELLAVVEAVAPELGAQTPGLVSRIRALPPTAAGRRSTLTLLRRCGAVLTRADLEQALAAARLGPDPWRAEAALLRDAFACASTAVSTAASTSGGSAAWRLALEAAARTPAALAVFRARADHPGTSRERLDALIDVFASTGQEARAALLDWMEALQPIDAPRWTLAEDAHRAVEPYRTPRDGDLDQPRSAAQRARLLAALDAPDAARRDAAASALRHWPEPETRSAVLRAYLDGRVDVTLTADLAGALTGLALDDDTETFRERAARAAWHLDPDSLHRLLPSLLDLWERGGPATRAAAAQALGKVPDDTVAERLAGRLDAGAWGFLDLLADRPLLRTPALTETVRRLRAGGRDDLADRLTLVDGPLRAPGTDGGESATLAALRERQQPPDSPGGPARADLIRLARSGDPAQIRRALTGLAEAHEDGRPDPELEGVLAGLLHHPESRVRLQAHRAGRRVLDRATYLRHTAVLLDDPEPDVVRSAVGTLSHAAYRPAIPAIAGLLVHPRTAVRRAAADALVRIGPPAVPALTYAASHARPDKRHHYTAVLDLLTEAGPAGLG
ncbi:HEAT repeat domain-containing protein [Catenuloplanes sp. NPDC051500]|uniref:HEAT repeat domain-containing protein n=1 Tax=Catenuloplanes sp. NPDC051500 TaxID=3363959 RepID=UPI0037B8E300